VDVVMLGHSDVGKTTYISSMYQAMQRGARGFTLQAALDRDHRKLTFDADEILRGRFPAASDRAAQYPMMLRHAGRDIFPVTWHDHRGGALRENTWSRQTATLLHRLETADGFLLFGDAPGLLDRSNRSALRATQDLVTQVLRVLPERRGRATPLVIVITKVDLVNLTDQELARAATPFKALTEAVREVADVHLTIAPVASGPVPRGILRPALWTLCFGLIERSRQLGATVGTRLSAARAAAQQDTVMSRVKSALGATPAATPQAVIREQQDLALREWSDVMPLIGHAVHLLSEVSTLDVLSALPAATQRARGTHRVPQPARASDTGPKPGGTENATFSSRSR
jgi:hypothetical protein